MKTSFELMQPPELSVACVRNSGSHGNIGQGFGKLFRRAGSRRLMGRPDVRVLAGYHDDPETTGPEDLRADACVTVPPGTEAGGEVGTMTVPGGLLAVPHAKIVSTEFGAAWSKLVGEWLPQSGHRSDDRMCYEVGPNDHEQHPETKFVVDIC